jgi:hypothetical protein
MQVVLDNVWKYLLPAMQTDALPADLHTYNELLKKLAALSLPLANGQASSPMAKGWSGKTCKMENNDLKIESVAIQSGDKHSTLTLCDERGEHRIRIGYSTWQKGIANLRGRGDEAVAACGAWAAGDTYEVRICMVEDAFCPIFRLHFTSGELQMEIEPNATWDWEPAGITKISGHVSGQA